jgi:hypothetical protein
MRTNHFDEYAELYDDLGEVAAKKLDKFLFSHTFLPDGYRQYCWQREIIDALKEGKDPVKMGLCCRDTANEYLKKFSKQIYPPESPPAT